MITLTYSYDLNKPIDLWTIETYDDLSDAIENACNLLETGFYVKLIQD